MAKIFKHNGQHGNYDDREDNKREVSLNSGQIAEIIACHNKNRNPCYAPQDIITGKARVSHFPDPSHKWGKCADNREKSRNDYRLPPVFFIEFMGSVKIFPVKKPDVFLVKNFRAHKLPYCVVYNIAGHSGSREQYQKPFDLQYPKGGKSAKSKKEGIAGQEGGNDETGFAKDDEKEDEICPPTEILNDHGKMPVKVDKEIS